MNKVNPRKLRLKTEITRLKKKLPVGWRKKFFEKYPEMNTIPSINMIRNVMNGGQAPTDEFIEKIKSIL